MRLYRTAYYIHRDCLSSAPLPETHRALILEGLLALQRTRPRFSFTAVESDTAKGECIFSQFDFGTPWPARGLALRYSTKTKTIRRLKQEADAPILLHPEQVLPEWHPYHQAAHTIDSLSRELNLYSQVREPVRASEWHRLLRPHYFTPIPFWTVSQSPNADHTCQLKCRGCCLAFEERRTTARHRTAMMRKRPSRPIGQALRDGLITPRTTVLDYGCGRGEDAAYLQSLGITIHAWDPVHRPHRELLEADVVNLGYVLNVIEDPLERMEALQQAFKLARQVLIVAALIGKNGNYADGTKLGDGILTRRGTFQRYFSQRELRHYIESGLGHKAKTGGPGLFYVFRNGQRGIWNPRTSWLPRSIVRSLRVGKVLPDGIYIHSSALPSLPASLRKIARRAAELLPPATSYNVLKISRNKPRVSFLLYPAFDTDPYPVLSSSLVVDINKRAIVAARRYSGQDGWILHRKDLLVANTYPHFQRFKNLAALQKQIVPPGTRAIARKKQWTELLIQNSVDLDTLGC